jgi:cytochrome c peroxidase
LEKKRIIIVSAAALGIVSASVSWFAYKASSDSESLATKIFSTVEERYAPPLPDAQVNHKLNPLKVSLGKTLFFDPRLSGSNWISCATCHNPTMGWSDGLKTGIGTGQKSLKRATPTILNAAYNFVQMWDGRFRSLEDQALGPIGSPNEMNQDVESLVEELKQIPGYVELFRKAFPGQGLTKKTIASAIADFERTIVSTEAPFDRWVKGDVTAISAAAKRGFELFEGKAHCSTCHSGYRFTDDGFHNIGLKDNDPGRFSVVAVPVTKGAFKTPTLRDIEKTAPYMHNGAYDSLEQVVEHYVRGGDDKSNLSPNFKRAELNKKEIADLVEFLKTLTGKNREIQIPRMPI